MMQSLTLDWQVQEDDPEAPWEEDRVTLKVTLKDGASKILAIDPSELKLYKSFFKGTTLLTWDIGQRYSTLKQNLEELLSGDVEILFYEAINIVVWWRMLRCEEGADFPYTP
jgi:hypothetical protein